MASFAKTDASTPIRRKPVAQHGPVTAAPSSKSSYGVCNGGVIVTILQALLMSSMLASWALPAFRPWLTSGTPVLAFAVLLGESHSHRVFSSVPAWAQIAAFTLTYAVCSTSWLLYLVFTAVCWPAILVISLYQFDATGRLARTLLRRFFLRNLHFINDQIGLFNIPALEIDTDVKGLFVVRAVTLSISTMTLVAHGVETGIKLSDEIELAIQTDKVVVRLFRDIHIDDVYANIKGGDWEVTFGDLACGKPEPSDGPDDFIARDTAILRAATTALDGTYPRPKRASNMVRSMTADRQPVDAQDRDFAMSGVRTFSPAETVANREYDEMIDEINDTSLITEAKKALRKAAQPESSDDDNTPSRLDPDNMDDMRAAVCAHIHNSPSIPHPPTTSIRVSTLSKNNHPRFKQFLHRLPLLYRLMLSPLCYLHPVKLQSITVAGSGKWLVVLMRKYLFKHYSSKDSEIRRLEERIAAWYEDASFAFELGPVTGEASFPVSTAYDIKCHLKVRDVMAYRMLPATMQVEQVVRLGGGDALLAIPTWLFPHHEHIFPAKATEYELLELEERVRQLEEEDPRTPEAVKARKELKQRKRDEANVRVSAHAHLPAHFHQHLLNFVAALVKATKLIERDNAFEEAKNKSLQSPFNASGGADSDSHEVESLSSVGTAASVDTADTTLTTRSEASGFRELLKKMDTGIKTTSLKTVEGMRKAGLSTLSAMANDRWIAALVGKVTRKLESAQGEVGYSFDLPVPLAEARSKHEFLVKLLP